MAHLEIRIHSSNKTHMNKPNAFTQTLRAAALIGAFSLVATSASQAAFVGLPSPTPEVPGAALGGLTATGGGTVLADQTSSFSNSFSTGSLRSIVVNRGGGALDFYYQLVNTTGAPAAFGDEQFWRLNILSGFNQAAVPGLDPVTVAQTNIDPVTNLPVGGLKPATSADRDFGAPGDVAFEFPVAPGFTGDPLNIAAGQSSTFLVVRTNSTTYLSTTAHVSSGDTGIAATFAVVPEPSSVLFGLAMFGVALTSRVRGRGAKVA
jgi:hypothetical protein